MANQWIGQPPERCDLCKSPIRGRFIDGRTAHGPWAIMCGFCHSKSGVGYGIGKGQEYVQPPGSDAYLKVQ